MKKVESEDIPPGEGSQGAKGVNPQALDRAVALGRTMQQLFVCTADMQGFPHMAVAGEIKKLSDKGYVAVEEWFCPGTLANVSSNPWTTLVVWDATSDDGYQLVGETLAVEELGILNGYTPQLIGVAPPPQVLRRLVIRVDRIFSFKRAPHTDGEIDG
jgi:hypothetical protein